MISLLSNAPEHWPKIAVDDAVLVAPYAIQVVNFSAAVKRKLDGHAISLKRMYETLLGSEGVLDVPCVAEEAGREAALFLYPEANDANARHFLAAQRYLERDRGMTAYYFAPKSLDLSLVPSENPFRLLAEYDLTKIDDPMLDGMYAMWWPSTDSERYIGSLVQHSIRSSYEALDGFESYVFAAFCKSFELVNDKESMRVSLPESAVTIWVRGPEDRVFIFSASSEKGIRFQFQKEGVSSSTYRDHFLAAFSIYAKEWKKALTDVGASRDINENTQPFGWYQLLEKTISSQGGVVNAIGGRVFESAVSS